MDDFDAAAPQPEAADSAAAVAPAGELAPKLAGVTNVGATVAAWFAAWYPENPPAHHPAPYLSGPWHHAHEAFADLKGRLGVA